VTTAFASLFLSHGAPTLPISDIPARAFLRELGPRLARPRAIVVLSPHWMTPRLAVKSPPRFDTWHDFHGFPEALGAIRYDAPGDAALRDRAVALLKEARLGAEVSEDRRLDHGVWVPLSLMFARPDVPLVQVSSLRGTPQDYFGLGRALAPLAQDGVLIVGTGGMVHNLREIDFDGNDIPGWAREFEEWVDERVRRGDWEALLDYRRQAPHAARAHPTDEHFLPLFFAAGAGGAAEALHRSFAHGSLGMACYGFA